MALTKNRPIARFMTSNETAINPAARLLVDVRQPRHENVDFPQNRFFEELCGQVVLGETFLLAGAPGSNKSTLARQLAVEQARNGKPSDYLRSMDRTSPA